MAISKVKEYAIFKFIHASYAYNGAGGEVSSLHPLELLVDNMKFGG